MNTQSPFPQGGAQQTALTFWIIWFALLQGMFIIMKFAGGGWPSGEDATSWANPMVLVPFGLLLASTFVRWVVLPKVREVAAKLPPAMIGMALGEGAMILAMFVLPKEYVQSRQIIYILAFLVVGSYIPLYLHKKPGSASDLLE